MHHDGKIRLLTALMYLNDVEEGGETFFPFASNNGKDEAPRHSAIEAYEKNQLDFETWCGPDSISFMVRPKKGRIVLFYSNKANVEIDDNSHHGSCPVKKGTMHMAQLWVRHEYHVPHLDSKLALYAPLGELGYAFPGRKSRKPKWKGQAWVGGGCTADGSGVERLSWKLNKNGKALVMKSAVSLEEIVNDGGFTVNAWVK